MSHGALSLRVNERKRNKKVTIRKSEARREPTTWKSITTYYWISAQFCFLSCLAFIQDRIFPGNGNICGLPFLFQHYFLLPGIAGLLLWASGDLIQDILLGFI